VIASAEQDTRGFLFSVGTALERFLADPESRATKRGPLRRSEMQLSEVSQKRGSVQRSSTFGRVGGAEGLSPFVVMQRMWARRSGAIVSRGMNSLRDSNTKVDPLSDRAALTGRFV
jgi:hypothetical protein